MLSVNRTYFVIFLMMLLGGMYFYSLLPFVQFIDELIPCVLICLALLVAIATNSFSQFNKLWIAFAIFIFYLLYSIYITQYNSKNAILSDFFVQLKPYIAFFATYTIAPKFAPKEKNWLRTISVILVVIMFLIFLLPDETYRIVYYHPAFLGINATVLALVYYYCSDASRRNKIIALLILAIGFCGTRSKFYGFFVVSVFVLFFLKKEMLYRIKVKYIVVAVIILSIMLLVAWQKINFYFINPDDSSTESFTESAARAALYVFAPEILADYPFFGTGLASYATYFSGTPYSSLYAEYGMDRIWGLSERNNMFVADTYYPVMVQFGYVGLFLYIIFIRFIYKNIKHGAISLRLSDKNIQVALLCLIFILIESVAGATFIMGGGIMAMMLMGMALGNVQKQ